jgi:16S rRNA pseudouridine516 synthase
MRLVRLIANLGYGSRKEVAMMFREGRITDAAGDVLYADDKRGHADIRIDGEPLDAPAGLHLMLHKPVGVTCSTKDAGRIVHDLLPARFRLRNPALSTVGRLDRDTSGLLLLTDDGALLHRIISPKSRISKVYEAVLAEDLRGDEVTVFASGELMLEAEKTPLLPATLEVLGARHARLTRMKAATIRCGACLPHLAIMCQPAPGERRRPGERSCRGRMARARCKGPEAIFASGDTA